MAPVLSILTPATPGAIAILQVTAPDAASLEDALIAAGVPLPAVGRLRVGSIAGVDDGVVARWVAPSVLITPHAGPAVVAEIVRRLEAAGIRFQPVPPDPRATYPEAADAVEARMLAALATAPSPLAIDLLLDQPSRWRSAGAAATSDPARDAVLRRLLTPPLVVAFGPPNIGKSTLCNALAGRSVAVVADEAGTTRDHVGVMLDLGGLTIRYVDSPGMSHVPAPTSHSPVGMARGQVAPGPVAARPGASADEREAVEISLSVLRSADLVIRCGDAGSGLLPLPPGVSPAAGIIDAALRADLGQAAFPHDVAVSAAKGQGIERLGHLIRDRLIPGPVLSHPGVWKFWD